MIGGYDPRHGDIVGERGYLGDDLAVIGYARKRCGNFFEQPVIESFATTQSIAVRVEPDSRHNYQIDVRIVGHIFSRRFGNSITARGHLVGGIRAHGKSISLYDRKQNSFLRMPVGNPFMGTHFIG